MPTRAADVVIVGAGAAGLTAAIFCRRLHPARSVILLDGARRPGAKILVSGGSRCNVTNVVVTERDFWGGKPSIVRRVLRAMPVPETVAFFRELGVSLHEEAGGKLFPDTNRARDVLDALLREVVACGVELLSDHRVTNISNTADRFIVHTPATEFHASRVVLATGGQSLPKSGSDGAGYEFARRLGHTVVPTTPALVPLLLTRSARGAIHEKLSGISHDVELAVWVDDAVAIRLRGSLLWTHFGISGPVVLNASRHWLRARLEQRPVRMTMTVFPGASFEQIDSRLVRWTKERPKGTLRTLLGGEMPAAVAAAILQHLELDEDRQGADLSKDERRRLVHALVAWPLPVEDSRGWNYAEATAGGVALDEIDPATMASRRCRGLSLVGEVLDVDGRIGGFNFQWAWATGRAAADGLGRE